MSTILEVTVIGLVLLIVGVFCLGFLVGICIQNIFWDRVQE